MDYDLLLRFQPRLLDVVVRDEEFWRQFDHQLLRDETRLQVLGFVYQGKGSIALDDERTELAPGSLFQVRPGVRMHLRSDREDPLCFHSIHFASYLINEASDGLAPMEGRLPFPPHIAYVDWQTVHQSFRLLLKEWNGKQPGYEWRCKLAFLSLVDEVVRLESMKRDEHSNAIGMERVIQYINAHFSEPIDRERLAAYANLSPSYFSTVFKQQTGYSPVQYVNKVRIDQAKQLLRSTALPIAEVSSHVGFEDSFYFARLFSKATGFSPRDYRKA